MEWTRETVKERLEEISQKGFIAIPEGMYRRDDGIVGQVLEREFGVEENNLHIADLGTYELKGLRTKQGKSSKLTLFHQKPTSGLTPLELFERFCTVKPSQRDGSMKRKLFTTVKGDRENNLGLILRAGNERAVELYCGEEYLATWDLTGGKHKINQTLLAFAETRGKANTREEQFHYIKGYILSGPKDISEAINAGAVVLELCIDQPADCSQIPHDRGPHIRIPVKKLHALFDSVERIL